MPLRPRSTRSVPRSVASALLALSLPVLASCQVGGGASKPPIPYEEIQGNLERAYDSLEQGIQGGSPDQVPSLCNALSAELDRLEEETKGLSLLEKEKIRIQLATARHGVESIARTAPASGDTELLKAQLQPVTESVHEITGLLGQLAIASKSSP